MRATELRLGVPPAVVEIWRRNHGENLLPLQARAVEEGGLLDGERNVLLVAPGGAGSSAILELAEVKTALDGRPVLHVVQSRSAADERHRELEGRYGPAGLRVGLLSGIGDTRFDIAVLAVTELPALLATHPELAGQLGLVVVDPLGPGFGERGAAAELGLTQLMQALRPPRILAVSSVVADPEALAAWLDAVLVHETTRPVEVFKGVLFRGSYRAVGASSGAERNERFEDHGRAAPEEEVAHAAKELVARGDRVLVQAEDRRRTVRIAQLLASLLPHAPPAGEAIAELARQPECVSRESLTSALGHAVAFLNVDLARADRDIVARHFRSGAIRALVVTSGAAAGTSLRADSVITTAWRWRSNARLDRLSLERLRRREFEALSGRAGRMGGATIARAILLTDSPFEASRLRKEIILAPCESVVPPLQFTALEDAVLTLVASRKQTRAELVATLLETYSGRMRWRKAPGELGPMLDAAIGACRRAECLEAEGSPGELRATPIGLACVRTGVRFASTDELARWAHAAEAERGSPLETLLVAHLSPAGRDIYVPLSGNEQRGGFHRQEIVRRASEAGVLDRVVIARLVDPNRYLPQWEMRAITKTLILLDLFDGAGVMDTERRYQVWTGTLHRIAEDSARLVLALAEIGGASGWTEKACARMRGLAHALTAWRDAAPDTEPAPETLRSARTPALLRPLAKTEPCGGLLVDLSKPEVRYAGHEIRTVPPDNISRLPLLALAVLASRPDRVVSMAELADEMTRLGGHLRSRLVAADVRYRILRPLRLALAGKVERVEIDRLIETVPGRGLRLPARAAVVSTTRDAKPRSAA